MAATTSRPQTYSAIAAVSVRDRRTWSATKLMYRLDRIEPTPSIVVSAPRPPPPASKPSVATLAASGMPKAAAQEATVNEIRNISRMVGRTATYRTPSRSWLMNDGRWSAGSQVVRTEARKTTATPENTRVPK